MQIVWAGGHNTDMTRFPAMFRSRIEDFIKAMKAFHGRRGAASGMR
jgi:hypothetical protein